MRKTGHRYLRDQHDTEYFKLRSCDKLATGLGAGKFRQRKKVHIVSWRDELHHTGEHWTLGWETEDDHSGDEIGKAYTERYNSVDERGAVQDNWGYWIRDGQVQRESMVTVETDRNTRGDDTASVGSRWSKRWRQKMNIYI